MSDYTPSTDRAEDRYRHARRLEGDGDKGRAEFERFLATVRADHEKAVRERIAQAIEEAAPSPGSAYANAGVAYERGGMLRASRIAREEGA